MAKGMKRICKERVYARNRKERWHMQRSVLCLSRTKLDTVRLCAELFLSLLAGQLLILCWSTIAIL